MDKTYAELIGEKPFDWNLFLHRASTEGISRKEYLHALDLAQDWPTCACGNQCAIIPRSEVGTPLDQELYEKGHSFSFDIETQNWGAAKEHLRQIEKRAAILVEEELQKKGGLLPCHEN